MTTSPQHPSYDESLTVLTDQLGVALGAIKREDSRLKAAQDNNKNGQSALVAVTAVQAHRLATEKAALDEQRSPLEAALGQARAILDPPAAPTPPPVQNDGLPPEITVRGTIFYKHLKSNGTFYVPAVMYDVSTLAQWPGFTLSGRNFSAVSISIDLEGSSATTVAYFVEPSPVTDLPEGAVIVVPVVPEPTPTHRNRRWLSRLNIESGNELSVAALIGALLGLLVFGFIATAVVGLLVAMVVHSAPWVLVWTIVFSAILLVAGWYVGAAIGGAVERRSNNQAS